MRYGYSLQLDDTFPLRDLPLAFDTSGDRSKHLSLYEAVRGAIVSGRLPPGARLPASRDLARQLGLSRGTVASAYDELVAEGFVRGSRGAGTFVADSLPDSWFAPGPQAVADARPREVRLSSRGERLTRSPFLALPLGPARPFRPHTPAVEPFPRARWMQLVARHARRSHTDQLRDVDARGYRPLREALTAYLRASRGLRCNVDQVVIVSGVLQALDLVSRLVMDPGESAWLEDPGYFGARCILEASGAAVVPVRVDSCGMDVALGIARAPRARLAYVTPARQVPLGSTLSLQRRIQLLDWADKASAWIFEDDYDSEFLYEGRLLPALQGLDSRDVVVHAGTFSKSLFTGLRIAYVVLPMSLVEAFQRALASLYRFMPLLPQAVLTDFIADGDLGRHLRRMRGVYAERRAALLEGLAVELDGELEIVGGHSGFEVLGLLQSGMDDRLINKGAKEAGIELMALSRYAIEPRERGGLLLGFASVSVSSSRRALPALRRLVRCSAGPS
jgi:GntR family transcriptional regulator/MocR family aminotransferase